MLFILFPYSTLKISRFQNDLANSDQHTIFSFNIVSPNFAPKAGKRSERELRVE
jgi:hypothetical protein